MRHPAHACCAREPAQQRPPFQPGNRRYGRKGDASFVPHVPSPGAVEIANDVRGRPPMFTVAYSPKAPQKGTGRTYCRRKYLKSLALPRGLQDLHDINMLATSGTSFRSMGSQGFSPTVSHRFHSTRCETWAGGEPPASPSRAAQRPREAPRSTRLRIWGSGVRISVRRETGKE
jgi:hypothetical protein